MNNIIDIMEKIIVVAMVLVILAYLIDRLSFYARKAEKSDERRRQFLTADQRAQEKADELYHQQWF